MSCARRGPRLALAAAALAIMGSAAAHAAPAGDCQSLAKKTMASTIEASLVEADSAVPPAYPGLAPIHLPAYCRVKAELRPVLGSRIGFELWLPLVGAWTGRLQMYGNGGYSSDLPTRQMALGLAHGSAVVATDTGHSGDDPGFAVDHPQAIADWGYRAVHETALAAKKLTVLFYGRAASHAYFDGCSTGGHQALMEAQRFPGDFDGIVAGAPGADRVRLNAAFLWQFLANHRPGDNLHPILGREDLALLQHASFLACHGANGTTAGGSSADTWLDDPIRCRFDPAVLACPDRLEDHCLTPEQIAAARKMYAGAIDPRTGATVTTPWLPGSEKGWAAYWADPRTPGQPARVNFWRVWAFDDPRWDWWHFSYGNDLAAAMRKLSPIIDATDPDLRRFHKRGGKLLQYHGLADPVVSPLDSIHYYKGVKAIAGERTIDDWYRLFLLPGMSHCAGGEGFWRFDAQAAIENWVEKGSAPAELVAARLSGTETRPICRYPGKAMLTSRPGMPDSYRCQSADARTGPSTS